MTQAHLVACPSCSRHVRVSETGCPFCGGVLGQAFRQSPAPKPPAARLTRAALRAFGTGTLALTAACGSSSGGTNGPGPDASSLDAGFDAIQAAYGAPAIDSGTVSDAGTAADGDTIPDAPMGIAAYGAPAIDSGGH